MSTATQHKMDQRTQSQKMAQVAYERVSARKDSNFKDYATTAKKFPSLIHTCGLSQAVAFGLAKGDQAYLDDLASVLRAVGYKDLADASGLDSKARSTPLVAYLRLSRDALLAAGWLKRYAEAAQREADLLYQICFWLPAGSNVMPKPWLNKEQIMRKTLVDRLEKVRDKGQHPGLLLQRYLAKPATGEMGDPDEKHRLLAAAIQAAHNSELQTLYRLAFERYYQLLSSTTQPWECKDFRTQTRLIVGLGSENVLETGITVHHTYGMPYIPGSALKGVAAHYCHRVYGAEDARFSKPEDNDDAYREYMQGIGPYPGDNYHRLLFGTNDDSGCIVFYDALLIPDRKQESLQLDVMTPHHMGWNNTSDPRAPTDFDSPTPVPYLSVRGRFRVCLSWRGPASDRAASWLAFAMKVLEEAVRLWGVGGKTSSGYGRLIPVT